MFWNNEFLDPSPSNIDLLLQMQTVKLSDILFEDDLLQELKTSNPSLSSFLNRREIINELLDNITRLTEKDCCDKLLYSNVHAAYISCEIITTSTEILSALVDYPESLSKIISCLAIQPRQHDPPVHAPPSSSATPPAHPSLQTPEGSAEVSFENSTDSSADKSLEVLEQKLLEASPEKPSETSSEKPAEVSPEKPAEASPEKPAEASPEMPAEASPEKPAEASPEKPAEASPEMPSEESVSHDPTSRQDPDQQEIAMTKVVPQKAALVSKLISTIHSVAAPNLSCHITQDIASFSGLINLLVQNIDISGSFEILSTFIKRTQPSETRYVFCEVLSKLNFVQNLIDVMTLSEFEDKQRNACQLLCEIVVVGRQEASEQPYPGQDIDMLAELLESTQAVRVILNQMFSDNMRNSTAIVCGMKVLQTLIEQKPNSDIHIWAQTVEQTQEEIEKHLIKFHELLLNPPKQEPIKTTFGIIQKPLGYMRLEVVNLIRALISLNSPIIIRKLVELRTMKVIINLFFEYSWNNLLHTQVEQTLCLIINHYRRDEEFNFMMYHLRSEHSQAQPLPLGSQGHENGSEHNQEEHNSSVKSEEHQGSTVKSDEKNQNDQLQESQNQQQINPQLETKPEQNLTEIPSRALLSQLLNECDLIGRLLSPSSMNCENVEHNNKENSADGSKEVHEDLWVVKNESDPADEIGRRLKVERQRRRNGEQANFGHIIQMINSIAINRDLDTIGEHLDQMKDKRPELYDKWTTFVNVDVASFKEISLYYDVQSANNNVNHRSPDREPFTIGLSIDRQDEDMSHKHENNNSDQFIAYFSFTRETVIPAINVDVLPKLRRPNNAL